MIYVPLVHVFFFFRFYSLFCIFFTFKNTLCFGICLVQESSLVPVQRKFAAENELRVEDDSLYQLDSPT